MSETFKPSFEASSEKEGKRPTSEEIDKQVAGYIRAVETGAKDDPGYLRPRPQESNFFDGTVKLLRERAEHEDYEKPSGMEGWTSEDFKTVLERLKTSFEEKFPGVGWSEEKIFNASVAAAGHDEIIDEDNPSSDKQ